MVGERLTPDQMRQALAQACIGEKDGRIHFDFDGFIFSIPMNEVPGLYSYVHPEEQTLRPDTRKRAKA
jgi:hypothetical protein